MDKAAFSIARPGLALTVSREALADLSRLLRYGAMAPGPGAGLSVRAFLAHLGLDPAYVEERISTIFLDGRAVDDVDSAHVRPGSALSLSAAMPGVAGIMMRRSSPIARMRALELVGNPEVARGPDEAGGAAKAWSAEPVRLKLFNFIAEEAGPVLLARGLGIAACRLAPWAAHWARAGGLSRVLWDNGPGPQPDLAANLADRLEALAAADPEAWVLVAAQAC